MGIKFLTKFYIRTFFLMISLSALLLYAQAPECKEKDEAMEILVIGTGRILEGNMAEARKNAISDALKKGIEEYLARTLGSKAMSNNFQRLINGVIPESGNGIENFNILAEDKGEKQFNILIRIKVNEKLMEEKLNRAGVVLMTGQPIKLLFLVSQKKAQEGEISFWWSDPDSNIDISATELILYKVFEARGFNLTNRRLSVPESKISPQMRSLDPAVDDAVAWGKLFSSDVVILGNSEIVEDEFVSVTLRAIGVRTGLVIGENGWTESIVGTKSDTDPVIETLEKTINRIAMILGPQIINYFNRTGETVKNFKLELRDLKNFEQLGVFKDFLKKNIDGIKSLVQTRIFGRSITFSIEFSGETDQFLQKIVGHDKFPFLADIKKSEDGNIIVQVR